MIFSRPCVVGLFFRRQVSGRVFLPLSFLSPLGRPPFPAQRQIFSIWSYLHASGTMLGFYPRCAQMQSAKNYKSDGGAGSGSYISAGEPNAKACVSHASGRGRGCDRGGETCDRSDRRPVALAAGNELAEKSRYALRQCRSHVSARGATDREEIPDPGLRWRGNRAAAAGLGCDAKRHRRVRPHAHLVQYRQEPRGRVRFRARLRAQHTPAAGLDELRRGAGAHPRVVQEGWNPAHSLWQCGRADGWLLPQRDQLRRRPQRAQVPHRRTRRHDPGEARRCAAANSHGRHLSIARARRDRCRRMDRSLRRREARAAQGRQVLLLPRLVGRQRSGHAARQSPALGGFAGVLSSRAGGGVRRSNRPDDGQVRHQKPRGVAPARGGGGPAAAISAAGFGSMLQSGVRDLRRARRQERGFQADLRVVAEVPGGLQSLVPHRREHARQLSLRHVRTAAVAPTLPPRERPRLGGGRVGFASRSSMTQGIGARIQRKEDARHLHGRGNFVSDMILPGQSEVAFLRSPIAHGRIRRILKPTGTENQVFIRADLGDVAAIVAPTTVPGYKLSEWHPLAHAKVRFVGEAIAMCVAPTRAEAEDLSEQIEVEFDELPVLVEAHAAKMESTVRVHEQWDDNVFLTLNYESGFEAKAKGAPVVIRREIALARQAMVPMEGKAVLAHWDDRSDQLVVYASTQVPHIIRVGLAQFLGIDQGRVRLISPDVGGGFGYKCILQPEELCVAWLALKFRRPFRYVEDRREHLVVGANSRQHHYRLTAHADERGRLLALDADITIDGGAYSAWPFTVALEPGQATGNLPGPYDFRGYRCRTQCVATNKPGFLPYRGVARTGVCFAMELVIDAIARAVGREPWEVRYDNLVSAADMPYDNVARKHYDSGDYRKALTLAREKIGLEAWRERQSRGE